MRDRKERNFKVEAHAFSSFDMDESGMLEDENIFTF
jgi:hypothetical protein